MRVLTDADAIAALGPTILVPTMGSLHIGHLALIRQAADEADCRGLAEGASLTVFVNRAQFNVAADFEIYPRDLDRDAALAADAGASVLIAPDDQTVYPPGADHTVPMPPVATEPHLEDTGRPGHFQGVCMVLARLFRLIRPAGAVFGEKDWQQLQVARALVVQENLPIEILSGPTVREPDGLALSSRNVHLTPAGRTQALALSRSLIEAGRHTDPGAAESAMRRVLADMGLTPSYAAVRDAETLQPIEPGSTRPGRALVAANVTGVRLLDNMPWPDPPPF